MKSNYIIRGGYDASQITKGLAQTQKQLAGFQTQTSKAMSAIGTGMKLALGYVSIRAIAGFIKATTTLASDLTEVQNVVDVTFGSMADEVNNFAKSSITSFGLSELAAKKYTSTMGAMLKSSGLKGGIVKDMSIDLVKLSADMASFYNLSNDEAFDKIKSGMAGMSRPLRDLGINMNIVNLEAYAVSQGIKKAYKNMSQQEQQLLRYNYLLSVTGDAQGDFARTSNTWANQTKILGEQFRTLGATLGGGFINMLTPLLSVINSVIAKLQIAAEYFKAFTALIFGDGNGTSDGSASNIADITEDATDNMGDLGNAGSKAAKKIKNAFAGIDEITTIGSNDSSSGGGSDSSGSSGVGSVAPVDLGKLTKGEFKIDENITKVLKNIKKAAQPTINALGKLKNALKPLEDFAITSLKSLYDDVLVPVGNWVLGTGLPALLDILSNLLKAIDWVKLTNAFVTFNKAITPFATAVGTGLIAFIESMADILTPVIAITISAFSSALDAVSKVINSISERTAIALGGAIGGLVTAILLFKGASMVVSIALKLKDAIGSFVLAIAGHPVAAAALALAALAGAIMALKKEKFNSSDVGKYTEKLDDLVDSSKKVNESIKDGMKQRSSNSETIKSEYGAIGILADEYLDLSDNTSLTNDEQVLMKAYADELVKKIPELSKLIDAQTGAYKGTKDEIKEVIKKTREYYLVQAAQEDLIQIAKDMYTANKNIKTITNERAAAAKLLTQKEDELAIGLTAVNGTTEEYYNWQKDSKTSTGELKTEVSELKKKISDLDGQMTTTTTTQQNLNLEWDYAKDYITGYSTTAKDGMAKTKESVRTASSDITKYLDDINKKVSGMKFDDISMKVKIDTTAFNTVSMLSKNLTIKPAAYATGGFPSAGEMFIGNENGIEMMGRMGNKNVVANNNQITDGIKQAVIEAMAVGNSNQNNGTTQLNLIVDSEVLATAVDKGRNNLNRRTNPTMSFA